VRVDGTSGGLVTAAGEVWAPALDAAVGGSINGWANWTHVPSGELRHERRNNARAKLGLTPVTWKR
jgi:hypothetical protein